jgi:hypothetical protein
MLGMNQKIHEKPHPTTVSQEMVQKLSGINIKT